MSTKNLLSIAFVFELLLILIFITLSVIEARGYIGGAFLVSVAAAATLAGHDGCNED